MSDGNRDVDEDNNFAIGTVCFVRTEDLPVWPAVVIDGNPGGGESTPVSYRKVELFNEAKDVLTLHVNALTDFLKNLRNERDSDKSADARFSKACDDAECHVRALFMSSLQHMHPTTAPVADDEGLSRCLSRGNSRRLKGENVPIESFQVAQVSAKVESVLDTVLNVVQPLLAGMNDLHGRFQKIETVMGQKLARDEPILASMNDLKGRFHKIESSMGQMFAQVEHEDKKFVIGMQGMTNKIDEVHAQVTSPDNAAAAGERVQMSKSLGALTNKIDEVHAQLTSPGNVVAANDRDQMSKSLGAIHSTLKKMAVSSEAQQKAATAAVIKQIPELKDTIAGVQKELKKRNKLEKKGVTSDEFDKMRAEVVGDVKMVKSEMASVADMHKKWIQELQNDLALQEKECSELQKSRELIQKSWVALEQERAKINSAIEAQAKREVLVQSWEALEQEKVKLKKAAEAQTLKSRGEDVPAQLPKKLEINRQVVEGRRDPRAIAKPAPRGTSKPATRSPAKSPNPRPMRMDIEEEEVLDGGSARAPSRKKRKSPATKPDVPRTKKRAHYARTNEFSPTLQGSPSKRAVGRPSGARPNASQKVSKLKPVSSPVPEQPAARKVLPVPKVSEVADKQSIHASKVRGRLGTVENPSEAPGAVGNLPQAIVSKVVSLPVSIESPLPPKAPTSATKPHARESRTINTRSMSGLSANGHPQQDAIGAPQQQSYIEQSLLVKTSAMTAVSRALESSVGGKPGRHEKTLPPQSTTAMQAPKVIESAVTDGGGMIETPHVPKGSLMASKPKASAVFEKTAVSKGLMAMSALKTPGASEKIARTTENVRAPDAPAMKVADDAGTEKVASSANPAKTIAEPGTNERIASFKATETKLEAKNAVASVRSIAGMTEETLPVQAAETVAEHNVESMKATSNAMVKEKTIPPVCSFPQADSVAPEIDGSTPVVLKTDFVDEAIAEKPGIGMVTAKEPDVAAVGAPNASIQAKESEKLVLKLILEGSDGAVAPPAESVHDEVSPKPVSTIPDEQAVAPLVKLKTPSAVGASKNIPEIVDASEKKAVANPFTVKPSPAAVLDVPAKPVSPSEAKAAAGVNKPRIASVISEIETTKKDSTGKNIDSQK